MGAALRLLRTALSYAWDRVAPRRRSEEWEAFNASMMNAQSEGQFLMSEPLVTPEIIAEWAEMLYDAADVARYFGTNSNPAAVAREIYRQSRNGICIDSTDTGYRFTGYCEGVDAEFVSYEVTFPFTVGYMLEAVDKADDDSSDVWDDTHGCEDCGPTLESGFIRVNEHCNSCDGEGTIL